jgi:uncharacterized protein (DUF302 family)
MLSFSLNKEASRELSSIVGAIERERERVTWVLRGLVKEQAMKNFQYTVRCSKPFDAAVSAVEQKATEKGFRVLHTHDVTGTLAEKGFHREPLKIVEVCNARYAHEALNKDVGIALMLPCPIAVYTKEGKTYVSTMKPSVLAEFYPNAGIEKLAAEVEKIVLEIVESAR